MTDVYVKMVAIVFFVAGICCFGSAVFSIYEKQNILTSDVFRECKAACAPMTISHVAPDSCLCSLKASQ